MFEPTAIANALSSVFNPRGLLCGALMVSLSAHAAEWRVEPSIGVEETYSTNIGGESNNEEGGFVTDVSPGISIHGTGKRLKLNLDYRPSVLLYHSDSERNRIDHTLSGNGSLEAIENFFFIDTRASISQQFLSPTGARPTSNTTDTDNRYTASSYSISPYIRGYLFGENQYLLRNENTWTDTGQVSGTDEISGIYTNRTLARFDTPIKKAGLSLEYDGKHTEEGEGEIDTRIGRLIGHYRLLDNLIFSARYGYEKDDYDGAEFSGDVWGVGLMWNPTPRTSVEGFWEDHYYGSSYSARIEHRLSRSIFNITASRGIQTFDGLNSTGSMTLLEYLTLIGTSNGLSETLARAAALVAIGSGNPNLPVPLSFLSQQAQLVQRLEAVAVLQGVRNMVSFKVFTSKTEAAGNTDIILGGRPLEPLLAAESVNDRGVQLSWSHKLTALSTLTGSITHTDTDTETDDEGSISTSQDTFDIRLNRALSPKTNGFAGARYSIFDSDFGDSDYTEVEIFAGFNHRF